MRRLIVLTGPSHSGKSSVAEALANELSGPLARVAIDEIMPWLDPGDPDPWEAGLPVAYDVAAAAADTLLERDYTVLLESTFTFIPGDGRPGQFHLAQLSRFVTLGTQREATTVVVRLSAEVEDLLERRSSTGRLSREIVTGTWDQHEASPLPAGAGHEVRTSGRDLAQVAAAVLDLVRS